MQAIHTPIVRPPCLCVRASSVSLSYKCGHTAHDGRTQVQTMMNKHSGTSICQLSSWPLLDHPCFTFKIALSQAAVTMVPGHRPAPLSHQCSPLLPAVTSDGAMPWTAAAAAVGTGRGTSSTILKVPLRSSAKRSLYLHGPLCQRALTHVTTPKTEEVSRTGTCPTACAARPRTSHAPRTPTCIQHNHAVCWMLFS